MNNQKSSVVRNARVDRPERSQVEMQILALDQMVPQDHRCRIAWRFVQGFDLEPFYADIKTTTDNVGRPPIAPEILVALWLLATLDSIAFARELDRRCKSDMPYLWICGGVSVNYHTLSDFRVQHGEKVRQLLTNCVTSLMQQNLVTLDEVGIDGMRVRASAGSSSFRRQPTLQKLHEQAAKHVDELERQRADESEQSKVDARRQAAQSRAAREREERIKRALETNEVLAERREKRNKGDGVKTRTSTTDPQARRMKMANGGFNPAYNVQFATDGDARVIAAVDVNSEGTDGQQLAPMLEQINHHYGKHPKDTLVDSAYATRDSVESAESGGTKVVSTVPYSDRLIASGKDPHQRQNNDSDHFANFRTRMAEPEYQELYKKRPSIAEFPNAVCRNHNLKQFPVRGRTKVLAVTLWHALAFNFQRMIHLGAAELA